ncbi:MAG: ORF6N domain-containing protein, partial [Burkholderiales bacterium]
VETKHVNQAVRNNPERFPEGFILELTNQEKVEVVKNFDHLRNLKFSKVNPKAFAEQGLYMLATILKSTKAIETTIAIVKTFAQIKQLTQAVYQFSEATTHEQQVKIFERSADILADLLDNELIVSQKETEVKIKLPFFELSRKITKVKK